MQRSLGGLWSADRERTKLQGRPIVCGNDDILVNSFVRKIRRSALDREYSAWLEFDAPMNVAGGYLAGVSERGVDVG